MEEEEEEEEEVGVEGRWVTHVYCRYPWTKIKNRRRLCLNSANTCMPIHLLPLFYQHLFTLIVHWKLSGHCLCLVVAAAGVLMPMVVGRFCSDTCQLLIGLGPQKRCRAPIVFVPCVKPFH